MTINELIKKISSLPNENQLLLLKAALFKNDQAIKAWSTWCVNVDYEDIDEDSYKLYPLVYQNLMDLGVSMSPKLEKFKGTYRYHWSYTNHLFQQSKPVITALVDANIPVLMVKGATLAIHYYKTLATRPIKKVDIMIPFDKIKSATQILQQSGYLTQNNHIFKNNNSVNIHLHTYLIPQNQQPQAQKVYWEKAEILSFQSLPIFILCPTDMLFHTLIDGIYNNANLYRWIADAYFILEKTTINWERLILNASRNQVSIATATALTYLQSHFTPSIPAWAIEKLKMSTKSTYFQKRELIISTRKNKSIHCRMILHMFRYLRK